MNKDNIRGKIKRVDYEYKVVAKVIINDKYVYK